MTNAEPDPLPTLGAALAAEHARLRQAFSDVTSRAEAGDFARCEEAWDTFASDFEGHLRFEEAELFPRFEATGGDAGDEVARLSSEHHDLRGRVLDLGVGLRAHDLQPGDVRDFLTSLDRHVAGEETTLYPWATATFGSERPVCELREDG